MISCQKILLENALKGNDFSKMTISEGSFIATIIYYCCPSLEQKAPSFHLLQFSRKHRGEVSAQSIDGGIRDCVLLLSPNRTIYVWVGPFKAIL